MKKGASPKGAPFACCSSTNGNRSRQSHFLHGILFFPGSYPSRHQSLPAVLPPGKLSSQAEILKHKKTDMGDNHPCPFLIPKNGGPGRPRTYDNPVMSRGLYQLSYGSSSGKYASILSVWQEKKQHISQKCFLKKPAPGIAAAQQISSCRMASKHALSPDCRNVPVYSPSSSRSRFIHKLFRHEKSPRFENQGDGLPERSFQTTFRFRLKRTVGGDSRGNMKTVSKRRRNAHPGMGGHPPPYKAPRKKCSFPVSDTHSVPQLITEPGSIHGDAHRPGRIRELQGLHAHSRSSDSAIRGACRT